VARFVCFLPIVSWTSRALNFRAIFFAFMDSPDENAALVGADWNGISNI
jgi:hypothetical protein